MRDIRQIMVLAGVLAGLTAVNLLVPNPWAARALTFLLLLGGAFLLSPSLGMVPAILAIPLDWMLIGRSPHSGDLLVWAGFVALVYGVSEYTVSLPEQLETGDSTDSSSDARQEDTTSDTPEDVLRFPQGDGSEPAESPDDPTETLQELLLDHFRWARDSLDFDNLIYYHVHENRASVGYVINELGEIDVDQTLGADVSQGVGWVLRHDQSLDRDGQQMDWRSLQYHKQPVDLDRVWMSPVKPGGETRGVLVLEWASGAETTDGELEDFRHKVETMMDLDASIRALEKTHRQFRLREKIFELDVSEYRFENLVQRCLEVVRSLLPADRVEFLQEGRPAGDDTVVEQRKLYYDRCYEWVDQQNRFLRIDSMDALPRQTRALAAAAPPDVESILAGPVGDQPRFGVLILDHSESDYFTDVDESLFKQLLDQLNRLFHQARQLKSLRDRQNRYDRWLDLLKETPDRPGLQGQAEFLVEAVVDELPLQTGALYWRDASSFRLTALGGSGSPTESIDSDHPMIRRLVENASTRNVLFDDVSRFDRYEPPRGTRGIKLVPVRDEDQLLGFLALFVGTGQPGAPVEGEDFDRFSPLLARRLLEAHRRDELRDRAERDSVSQFLTYDAWKRTVTRFISREEPDPLTLWRLGVPAFEEICLERGFQRGKHWIQSLGNQIREPFHEDRVTRNYGTTFLGFCPKSPEDVQDRLDRLVRTLEDWSFPLGDWPQSPRRGVESFSPPYPDVDNMVDAARTVERQQVPSATSSRDAKPPGNS